MSNYTATSRAPLPREPYAGLPALPEFTLTSTEITNGGEAPEWMLSGLFGVPGGKDRSPQLSWSGFPKETRSFVITCFDPDAPTPSGFWHWCLSNIPATVTELPGGITELPEGALAHRNDAGQPGFLGATPPAGHGPHRYIFCITAVDTARLDIDEHATPTVVEFNLFTHGIGRAYLTVTHEAH